LVEKSCNRINKYTVNENVTSWLPDLSVLGEQSVTSCKLVIISWRVSLASFVITAVSVSDILSNLSDNSTDTNDSLWDCLTSGSTVG